MRWRRLLVVGAVLVLGAGAAGWPVYVHPRTDVAGSADPADAVLALGGLAYSAVYAVQLQEQGAAREVVISDPYEPKDPVVEQLCGRPHVTCFAPDPSTTRGEARELRLLAAKNGWQNVLVVAPTWHISRARLIVSRCYDGRLRMIDPGIPAITFDWPGLYLYQTAGYVKAALSRGC